MKTFRRKRNVYRFILVVSCAFLLLLIGIIPVRLAIASYQAPEPQAILTLGGGREREEFTAQFAKYYPFLDIWVSSGIEPEIARPIFRAAGIPNSRVHTKSGLTTPFIRKDNLPHMRSALRSSASLSQK